MSDQGNNGATTDIAGELDRIATLDLAERAVAAEALEARLRAALDALSAG